MTANYPAGNPALTQKTDLTSVVMAADVNSINDEVIAIGTTVGLTPQTRAANWGSGVSGGGTVQGSFTTTGLTYTTVGQRILNVENGTFIVYNDYVSMSAAAGRNVITPAGTSTVNLTLKGQTGQTAHLLEITPAGTTTPVVTVGVDGTLQAVYIDGGAA